ncbi:hypothetical protein T10_10383 [Trichinella papuae]|uniref:Uncharacterized protein n=1 Tax=Trichinella papuae TaxID=268474 RepID=A0A0V1MCG3_9BILA|nr:hypothetical protein T10_10383 [Trichinella papuae]
MHVKNEQKLPKKPAPTMEFQEKPNSRFTLRKHQAVRQNHASNSSQGFYYYYYYQKASFNSHVIINGVVNDILKTERVQSPDVCALEIEH